MDANTGVGPAKAVSTIAIGLPPRRVTLLAVPVRDLAGWNAAIAAWPVPA